MMDKSAPSMTGKRASSMIRKSVSSMIHQSASSMIHQSASSMMDKRRGTLHWAQHAVWWDALSAPHTCVNAASPPTELPPRAGSHIPYYICILHYACLLACLLANKLSLFAKCSMVKKVNTLYIVSFTSL